MKIIAFGHRRQVGKDTSCRFLSTMLRIKNKRVKQISFAKQLKQTCYDLFAWAGVEPPHYYEACPECKNLYIDELGMTVRELWIKIGNDIRELYHKDTWIRCAIEKAGKADILLVSDLRYPNEAETLKPLGATLIKLNRPDVPEYNDVADSALKDYKDWDYILDNDGSLEQLNQLMLDLAQKEHLL